MNDNCKKPATPRANSGDQATAPNADVDKRELRQEKTRAEPRLRRANSGFLPSKVSDAEIRHVDPFRCRIWDKHLRMEEYLSEDSCRGDIESVVNHGQLQPALGRPVVGDSDYDFEIIYGVRRLFVARHLNRPLLLEIKTLDDKSAAMSMEAENRNRQDISPYERGRGYDRWLRTSVFQSQEELARALHVSPAHVSRLLKLARLPAVVIEAFDSPTRICETWASDLLQAWKEPKKNRVLVARARSIAAEPVRPSAQVVYKRLLDFKRSSRNQLLARSEAERDQMVHSSDGTILFRVKHHRKAVVFLVKSSFMTESLLQRVKDALRDILQDETITDDTAQKSITISPRRIKRRAKAAARNVQGELTNAPNA